MGNARDWDPNWWKAPKAASLERKRRAAALPALAKPGDAFLIVTEGTVTEPVYFELLRRDLQLSVVRIKVRPGEDSAPRNLILAAEREANEQRQKYKQGLLGITEPPKFDQVWAVVDTDVAVRESRWNEVQQLAAERKINLAHSTPCFEFWLLLHFGYTTRSDLVDGDAAKRAVEHKLGRDYSTSKQVASEVIPTFVSTWPEAVAHAEKVRHHHEEARTRPPANPSTEVDRLVRALNDATHPHLRKLQP